MSKLHVASMLAALVALIGCTTAPADDGGGAGAAGFTPAPLAGIGGTGAGGVGGAGVGGSIAVGGAGGVGGAAGVGGAGAGGAGAGGAGAGGAGAGGAGAGGAGAGGAGGAGAGGAAGGGDTCVADVMAGGRDMICASCLCTMCGPELTAVDGDANANAMLSCITMANCSGSCCVCNAADCTADPTMWGAGPCGDEIQTAAGLTPMGDLAGLIANGQMVADNCDPVMSPATNSCGNAARLGECMSMKCMAECPSTATCN